MGLIRIPSIIISSTPAIESTPDYSSGDLLGPKATELANALNKGARGVLESLTIIDKEEVAIDMDIHFWSRNPTSAISSADNSAFAITDAEIAESYLGYVAVTGTDFKDVGGQKVVCYKNIGLVLESVQGSRKDLNAKGTSVWFNMIARAAGNYGSTGDLVLKFGIMQH